MCNSDARFVQKSSCPIPFLVTSLPTPIPHPPLLNLKYILDVVPFADDLDETVFYACIDLKKWSGVQLCRKRRNFGTATAGGDSVYGAGHGKPGCSPRCEKRLSPSPALVVARTLVNMKIPPHPWPWRGGEGRRRQQCCQCKYKSLY